MSRGLQRVAPSRASGDGCVPAAPWLLTAGLSRVLPLVRLAGGRRDPRVSRLRLRSPEWLPLLVRLGSPLSDQHRGRLIGPGGQRIKNQPPMLLLDAPLGAHRAARANRTENANYFLSYQLASAGEVRFAIS